MNRSSHSGLEAWPGWIPGAGSSRIKKTAANRTTRASRVSPASLSDESHRASDTVPLQQGTAARQGSIRGSRTSLTLWNKPSARRPVDSYDYDSISPKTLVPPLPGSLPPASTEGSSTTQSTLPLGHLQREQRTLGHRADSLRAAKARQTSLTSQSKQIAAASEPMQRFDLQIPAAPLTRNSGITKLIPDREIFAWKLTGQITVRPDDRGNRRRLGEFQSDSIRVVGAPQSSIPSLTARVQARLHRLGQRTVYWQYPSNRDLDIPNRPARPVMQFQLKWDSHLQALMANILEVLSMANPIPSEVAGKQVFGIIARMPKGTSDLGSIDHWQSWTGPDDHRKLKNALKSFKICFYASSLAPRSKFAVGSRVLFRLSWDGDRGAVIATEVQLQRAI